MNTPEASAPDGIPERVTNWIFRTALPFWIEYGLDRTHGGPVESLSIEGRDAGAPFKRTRVVARQLYTFSHAVQLGHGPAEAAADHVWDFFRNKVWQSSGAGWPRKVDRAGQRVLDATPDLYDYAFALFGLGWRYKVTRDAEALRLAHETMDILESRFPHTEGGFEHQLPASLPRQQNPHMHLTEAAIVLSEASGDPRFSTLADQLVDLFKTRILQDAAGLLPEFFNADWSPAAGAAGDLVEPGHQFEWAWILARHQALTGQDNVGTVRALVAFAERHGFDARTHKVVNAVSTAGAILDGGTRTWPSTERIKGWIGLNELTGTAARTQVDQSAEYLFRTHLGPPAIPGCWMDAYDADGNVVSSSLPASTLYHVFLSFAEILRRYSALDDGIAV